MRAKYIPLIAFIPNLAVAFLLYYGGRQVIEGNLSLGSLVAFYSYLMMLVYPAQVIGWLTGLAQRAIASGERVYQVLDSPLEMTEKPDAQPLRDAFGLTAAEFVAAGSVEGAGPTGSVTFDDVWFSYVDRPVLQGVSLEVPAGKTVALVGHTGCGKTTLTNLVPRFYDAGGGTVIIDGQDVRDLQLADLRRHIGIVNQDPFLFSTSIAENIRFGKPEASDDEVRAGGEDGAGRRLHRGAPRGLRDGHRGARLHAQRRPAAAHRDRAGARHGPAHPHPRRRHQQRRRGDGVQDPGRAAGSDARPHHLHHRPSPEHDLAGRGGHRARPRPDRGARHARGARWRPAASTRTCSATPSARAAASTPRAREDAAGGGGRRRRPPGGVRRGGLMATASRHSSGPHGSGASLEELKGWRAFLHLASELKLSRLARLAYPYRRRAVFSVVAMVVVTLSSLAVPYLLKVAIDGGIGAKDMTVLTWVIVAFVAVSLVNLGASYLQTYLTSWVGEHVIYDLRRQLFAHLQKLSLDFFSRQKTGWIVSRLTNDIDALDQLVTDGVTTLVTNSLTFVGAIVFLFILDWRLALATLSRHAVPHRGDPAVPLAVGARLRRGAQQDRRRERAPAGVHLGRARAQGVPPRAERLRAAAGRQRRLPRRELAHRRAERPLLPVRGVRLGGRRGHRPLVRRHAHRRATRWRSACSSPSSAT